MAFIPPVCVCAFQTKKKLCFFRFIDTIVAVCLISSFISLGSSCYGYFLLFAYVLISLISISFTLFAISTQRSSVHYFAIIAHFKNDGSNLLKNHVGSDGRE